MLLVIFLKTANTLLAKKPAQSIISGQIYQFILTQLFFPPLLCTLVYICEDMLGNR